MHWMFRVTVKQMYYDKEEPFSIKTYEFEDDKEALTEALYLDEECNSQSLVINTIVLMEEKKNEEWHEWKDSRGNKFSDYILWDGKAVLME